MYHTSKRNPALLGQSMPQSCWHHQLVFFCSISSTSHPTLSILCPITWNTTKLTNIAKAFVSFTSNIVSVSPYLRMIILFLATCLGSNRSTATRAILVIDLAIVISFDVYKKGGRFRNLPSGCPHSVPYVRGRSSALPFILWHHKNREKFVSFQISGNLL